MVIDGCGSPHGKCIDLAGAVDLAEERPASITPERWFEKDSFYRFDGRDMVPLIKDFSATTFQADAKVRMPTIRHSIGGFYQAISEYVFGDLDDVGKLMGLAPYGRPT